MAYCRTARFAAVRDAAHALLPRWLARLVPATAIGFAVLSSFTYAVDLLVLALKADERTLTTGNSGRSGMLRSQNRFSNL